MHAMNGVEKISDLVVVGAGGSGLIAAAAAAQKGLSVTLIEKAPVVGGTTALSVGTIMAAGTQQQRAAGIEDSPSAHAQDLDDIRISMAVGDDPELRRLLTENAADTVEFLRGVGINFLGPLPQPPHKTSRMHQVMPTSRAYIVRLADNCRRLGVDIQVDTRATKLIANVDGSVSGVEALQAGSPKKFRARGGVILASGDIGGDDDMMKLFLKNWTPGAVVYNPLNTGDGHKMAAAVGAHIVPRKDLGAESAAHIRFIRPPPIFLQKIPPYPVLTKMMVLAMKIAPSWAIRPIMMKFLTTTLGPDRGVFEEGAILVNKLGERFADERRTPNMLIPQQPDGMAYIVFDDQFAKKFSRWPHFISTAPGVAFAFIDDYRVARPDLFNKASTPEALAEKVGFQADRLKASIASANRERPASQQLTVAPYYALGPVQTFVMVAPVGLSVNTRLEVLTDKGTPIPGLYAVGNAGQAGFTVTGHGHGLGWAFTSGRLAAEQVATRVSAGSH